MSHETVIKMIDNHLELAKSSIDISKADIAAYKDSIHQALQAIQANERHIENLEASRNLLLRGQ